MGPDNISKGYKPHVVRELLGISQETLRYWCKLIQPGTKTSYFSAMDIYVYWILKVFNRERCIPIRILKTCKWSSLFKVCNNCDISEFNSYMVVFNTREKTLTIHSQNAKIDQRQHFYQIVYLDIVTEKFLEALTQHGEV